jgi:hypothetical protein
VTTTHCQSLPSSLPRISFLITCLILLALALSLSASLTLDTSTVQYSVSVKVDRVVLLRDRPKVARPAAGKRMRDVGVR